MKFQKLFWFGLWLGLFPSCSVVALAAQNTDCTGRELEAVLPSNDPEYPAAAALSEALDHQRISVKCMLRSTMEDMFEGQNAAVVYRTDHGSFEALFLPESATFDQLKIFEKRDGSRYSYRFAGPPQPWPANRIDAAFRMYFIKNRNILFVVDSDAKLAATLRDFVRSRR